LLPPGHARTPPGNSGGAIYENFLWRQDRGSIRCRYLYHGWPAFHNIFAASERLTDRLYQSIIFPGAFDVGPCDAH
jgi:hypothetical protein